MEWIEEHFQRLYQKLESRYFFKSAISLEAMLDSCDSFTPQPDWHEHLETLGIRITGRSSTWIPPNFARHSRAVPVLPSSGLLDTENGCVVVKDPSSMSFLVIPIETAERILVLGL